MKSALTEENATAVEVRRPAAITAIQDSDAQCKGYACMNPLIVITDFFCLISFLSSTHDNLPVSVEF